MRSLLAWILLLGSALFLCGGAPGSAAPPACGLLVPAYFYPEGNGLAHWDTLIQDAAREPKLEIVAIVNPASGPGRRVDANYTRVVERCRKAGVKLVGYVSTDYGKRPAEAVKADVDRWHEFYPQVQGIFFDEQASGADKIDWYADVAAHARKTIPKAYLVSNPGTHCDAGYAAKLTADTYVLFEEQKGFERYRAPAWAASHPPSRAAILVHSLPEAAAMKQQLEKAIRDRAGYLYLTDDLLPNPWDRLPTYWAEEVAALRTTAR